MPLLPEAAFSFIPSQPEVLIAADPAQLIEHAKRVAAGQSLVAVLHDAFDLDDCTPLPAGDVDELRIKSRSLAKDPRGDEGVYHIPLMNIAKRRHTADFRAIPPGVAHIIRDAYNAVSGEDLIRPEYQCQEFHSRPFRSGLVHDDGFAPRMPGLNSYLQVVGSSGLQIARFRGDVEEPDDPMIYGRNWDVVPRSGNVHQIRLRSGSLALFSVFGLNPSAARNSTDQLARGMRPNPHRVVTGPRFRANLSVDQLVPARTKVDQGRVSIDLRPYPGYEE